MEDEDPVEVIEWIEELLKKQLCLTRLVEIDGVTTVVYDNWADPAHFKNFERAYELINNLTESIHQIADTALIEKLHHHLYFICIENIKPFSETLPGASDPYQYSVLLNFYSFIAYLNELLYDRWCMNLHYSEDEDLQYKLQPDIPFCKEHNLVVSNTVAIGFFNFSELLSSLDCLEMRMHTLPYEDDLLQYLKALEVRIADFLLHAQDMNTHNVSKCRIASKTDPTSFACSTSAEYMLIIRILSIRKDMMGAIPHYRDHEACKRLPFEEELKLIPIIHNNLLIEAQQIHGDSIQNTFYNAYQRNGIFTSEGYSYLKENPQRTITESGVIVAQYRGSYAWKEVADKSAKEIDAHFYHMDDPLAFRLVFYYLMKMLMERCVRLPWDMFFFSNNQVKSLSDTELQDDIFMRSHRVPLFIESFNDAAIVTQGKMYVFGPTPVDYLRALYNWLDVIGTVYDDILDGGSDIYELRSIILFDDPDRRAKISKYTGVSNLATNLQEKALMSTEAIADMQRQRRLSYVLSVTTNNEIQATGLQQDLVDAGLIPSSSSAWDDF
jgi:hypothetical protein